MSEPTFRVSVLVGSNKGKGSGYRKQQVWAPNIVLSLATTYRPYPETLESHSQLF